VRRADVMELLGHDVLREFGLVAFAAQVREVKVLQVGGHDLRGGLGGGGIGKMAVPSKDALFQRPGPARTILQHLHVVVGFEDEDVRGTDAFEHELGDMPEVGGKTDVAGGGAEDVADGVLRVVRDGECFDAHVADFKARAGLEQPPSNFGFQPVIVFQRQAGLPAPLFLERPKRTVLRPAIAENRYMKLVGKPKHAGDMVGMLVGDKNRAQVLRRATDASQAQPDLARGKPGVHEDAGLGGLDVGAIAGGTAAEDGKFDGHDWKLVLPRQPGKFFRQWKFDDGAKSA